MSGQCPQTQSYQRLAGVYKHSASSRCSQTVAQSQNMYSQPTEQNRCGTGVSGQCPQTQSYHLAGVYKHSASSWCSKDWHSHRTCKVNPLNKTGVPQVCLASVLRHSLTSVWLVSTNTQHLAGVLKQLHSHRTCTVNPLSKTGVPQVCLASVLRHSLTIWLVSTNTQHLAGVQRIGTVTELVKSTH